MTPGVLSARANLGPNAVDVEYDPSKVDFDAIRRAIESAGHKVAEPKAADVRAAVEGDADPEQAANEQEYRTLMRKFWFAGAVSIPVMALSYRSEEHTSELQSLMSISYAVFCLKKKKHKKQ